MNFKNIHIGKMIEKRVAESGIVASRICNFMKCKEDEICKMYKNKSLDTDILLKWSKILEYDFFRIYSQHLILYAPISAANKETKNTKKIFFAQISQKYLHQRNYRFYFGTNLIRRNDQNASHEPLQNPKNDIV